MVDTNATVANEYVTGDPIPPHSHRGSRMNAGEPGDDIKDALQHSRVCFPFHRSTAARVMSAGTQQSQSSDIHNSGSIETIFHLPRCLYVAAAIQPR